MPSILIVEDENIVAMDIQTTLWRLGYDVAGVAVTGEEALRLAELAQPDCVLMDIMLRGELDGVDAAAIIRKRWQLPVVFVTAYTDDKSIARASASEPFGFIIKPFRDRELKSAIEIALYKHRAELALRERERWYATTLRSIGDGVISADIEQRVTFMNGAAERLTAWTAAEATGELFGDVFRVVNEDTRAAVEDPIARALRDVAPVLLPEGTALLRRDGTTLSIDDSAAPIVDDDGRILGAVVVFRDVSDKRRLQAQLIVADRMASVGVLAAGIGHEINNPLSYVVANLDFALEELVEPDKRVSEALEEAREGAERIGKIVKQLRTWARGEREHRKSVELAAVVDSACAMAGTEIRHRARLVKDYRPAPAVLGDETRLAQVFIILLVNAAQSIPEGNAERHEVQVTIRTGKGDDDGAAVVEVRDSGAGIQPGVLPRIFEPFFTTKPLGEGSGLGLPIVHSILASLGGRIEVDSVVGFGSTFTVTIPAAVGSASGDVEIVAKAAAGPRSGHGSRVLIVDDESLICGAVQRALSPGHQVSAFTSGRDALEHIARGERYDALLIDLLMPEMSGMDFFDELRRIAPELTPRVVFLSGGAFTRRAQEFLAEVENRHLEKPFSAHSLQQVLRELGVKANASAGR